MGTKGRHMLKVFGRTGPKMPAKSDHQGQRPLCFDTCVEVAHHHLKSNPASVLVGSSFGGAVTMAILQRRLWCGPVVLLAPAIAHYKLDLRLPIGSHAIIIHDPDDDLINFQGSIDLHEANSESSELWESDGGHKLHTITDNGMLERAVRRQIERAQALI